jgi:hypothetical protein
MAKRSFNLDDFRVQGAELEQLRRNQKTTPERKVVMAKTKRTDAFVMIPLSWVAKTGDPTLIVCADLVYRAWRAKAKTFTMPRLHGVGKHTKNRILRRLEQAGVIAVKWHNGKSPVVTLIVSIET